MLTVPDHDLRLKRSVIVAGFVSTLIPRLLLLGWTLALSGSAAAQLAFEKPPILYSKTAARDPVSQLAAKIASGELTLQYEQEFGYLLPLLRELEIPISSQTLVYSKTSMQRHLISPSNPRAIYFNREVYVGWIPNGGVIEIASTDPQLGTVFYTIDQAQKPKSGEEVDEPVQLIHRRDEACLFCHASSETGRVPGLLMQSVLSDKTGNRIFPPDQSPASELIRPGKTTHLSSLFAGWYATGTHGNQTHLANAFFSSDGSLVDSEMRANGNVQSLQQWFQSERYPAPDSDLVALLVLRHQVRMHNQLTDANHRTRHAIRDAELDFAFSTTKESKSGDTSDTARERELASVQADRTLVLTIDRIAEKLVDQLLLCDELQLTSPVSGTSVFASQFETSGKQDSQGRSLTQLSLNDRLLEYPCSYLVYSDSFDELPELLKQNVIRRIRSVLTAEDTRPKYNHMSRSQRHHVLDILRETHPAFSDSK